MTMRELSRQDLEHCIRECQTCHNACLQTLQHCLQLGGKHAEAGHVRLLLDCAEICETSANFMLRASPLHGRTCAVCADVCDRCAQDCERVDPNDQTMRRCAEVCRRCAEACRQMARMAA